MTKVLLTTPFSPELMNKISKVSDQISIEQIELPSGKWPADKTTEAEVIYTSNDVPGPEQAPKLRWVHTHWAGIDQLHKKAIWDSNIQITTASGIHAPAIGQYVMAQILAWTNKIPRWLYYQERREWPTGRWDKFLPTELRGKTIGIMGYGSVGREIARLSKAFGMIVLATKRDARSITDDGFYLPDLGDKEGTIADRLYPGEATRSMVRDCDFLVLALPLTPKTYHLVDEELLREMKSNCFLINVSRGAVINEVDLIKALKKRWIAGAGLDVFENEPLPADSELWSMENLILTPHISGFTPKYDERAVALFAENLRRYLDLEPLLNVVNREAGY